MLWKYRDRNNFMTFKSGELAELLGVGIYTMSRVLTEMAEKGFIKKVGSKYLISDPAIAAWIPDRKNNQESIF